MRKLVLALAGATALSIGSAANAAHELTMGENGSVISTMPLVLGPLLADTGPQLVSNTFAGVTLNTSMRAAVYGGAGYLDFVYQITNLATSNTSATGLSFADFFGANLGAGGGAYQFIGGIGLFGPGTEEADSARFTFAGALGVNFDTDFFPDINGGANQLLNPGETSAAFLFRVLDVSAFRPGTFTAQNGVTVTGAGFSPSAAVPEPATWAMMLLGFAGVGFAMRRGRRQAGLLQLA